MIPPQEISEDLALTDPIAETPEHQSEPQIQSEPELNSEVEPAPAEPENPFQALGLPVSFVQILDKLGYEAPTTIQTGTIPHLLAGRDVLAQAQTGTGKTAAFALPLLTRIDTSSKATQLLVLAPTRELAIQVAESFETYAVGLKGLRVMAIYGGQSYEPQLKKLDRGVQVVVGTPGRVMDHMRKGTLKLSGLQALVLDEADEMLRMGFVDDVEWILQQLPEERQMAMFSATMPTEIRRLARTYLKSPAEVTIQLKTATAETIHQRYWLVQGGLDKPEALCRMLEGEETDGVMIFVRTKQATLEVAEHLTNKGYSVAPLNGDFPQAQRERTVDQFRAGKLEVLVATDVAARGLDVERISHVINYDIPYDAESYIHRIGRTGRAGRSGQAILLVRPREQRLLKTIERATRQRIEPMELPAAEDINARRIARFKEKISEALPKKDMDFFRSLIADYAREQEVPELDVAAALAVLYQGNQPLLLPKDPPPSARRDFSTTLRPERPKRSKASSGMHLNVDLASFRIEVGRSHGVRPGQIVGAIANEAELDSAHIGNIQLYENFSTVDLPEVLEGHLKQSLQRTRVVGRLLKLSRLDDNASLPPAKRPPMGGPGSKPFRAGKKGGAAQKPFRRG